MPNNAAVAAFSEIEAAAVGRTKRPQLPVAAATPTVKAAASPHTQADMPQIEVATCSPANAAAAAATPPAWAAAVPIFLVATPPTVARLLFEVALMLGDEAKLRSAIVGALAGMAGEGDGELRVQEARAGGKSGGLREHGAAAAGGCEGGQMQRGVEAGSESCFGGVGNTVPLSGSNITKDNGQSNEPSASAAVICRAVYAMNGALVGLGAWPHGLPLPPCRGTAPRGTTPTEDEARESLTVLRAVWMAYTCVRAGWLAEVVEGLSLEMEGF